MDSATEQQDGPAVAESWEQLNNLSINDKPSSTDAGSGKAAAEPSEKASDGKHANHVAAPPTPNPSAPPSMMMGAPPPHHHSGPPGQHDQQQQFDAVRQALGDSHHRGVVLKYEDIIEKFLKDQTQEVLQFPSTQSSYQRMLAHRVAQYYGLQTSTVDYEESQVRVVAVRTALCQYPRARLRDMAIEPSTQRAASTASASAGNPGGPVALAADKPRLLRRQDADGQQPYNSGIANQSPARSFQERKEDYMRAREQLGLGPAGAMDDASGGPGGHGQGGGRGMGGRYGGGRWDNGGRSDGGRGRKAVFRDKDKDLNDPDYRRGVNRFSGAARMDPAFVAQSPPSGGIYHIPTYQSEFPALGGHPKTPTAGAASPAAGSRGGGNQQGQGQGAGWNGNSQQQQQQGGMRPPPPPPPPHAGGSPGPLQKPGSGNGAAAAGMSPAGMAAVMPGAGMVPHYQAMAYPTGQPAAFAMPMPAGYMPAAGQAMYPQGMYGAPGAAYYPAGMAVPPGAYPGYMAAPGQEAMAMAPGAYPMYATGYAAGPAPMYASAMAQGQMQHPGMRPVMYGMPVMQYAQPYDPSAHAHAAAYMHDGRGYGGGAGMAHGVMQQQHHGGGGHSGGEGGGGGRNGSHNVGGGGGGNASSSSHHNASNEAN